MMFGGTHSFHDFHYTPPDWMGSLGTRRTTCYLMAHLFIDLIDARSSRRFVLDGLVFSSYCLTTMTVTEGESRDTGKFFPLYSSSPPHSQSPQSDVTSQSQPLADVQFEKLPVMQTVVEAQPPQLTGTSMWKLSSIPY